MAYPIQTSVSIVDQLNVLELIFQQKLSLSHIVGEIANVLMYHLSDKFFIHIFLLGNRTHLLTGIIVVDFLDLIDEFRHS